MPGIATTRFNHETWCENMTWKETHGWSHGCVYGTHNCIKDDVVYGSTLYVLEMNNDNNKIMGIGKIQNKIQVGMSKKDCKIYGDAFYCKFIYKGNMRVARIDMNKREKNIVRILDILVFKGSGHLKRGKGITMLSNDVLISRGCGIDFLGEIICMFKRRC